jgi:hypothetical protein
MRITVATQFDCTATGVTGHFRQAQLPMTDRAGQSVTNEQEWNRSRNQQRNFETLLQLIGLYTQPLDLTDPWYDSATQQWSFDFSIEFDGVFATENDTLGLLKKQANGVPMITGLQESQVNGQQLISDSNIFFSELNITT